MSDKPKIYVFCNSCAPQWHSMLALAEDGTSLAGHLCSAHAWAKNDMGFTSDWKHEAYNEHYPGGWQLEYVELISAADIDAHPGLKRAIARAKERPPVPADSPHFPRIELELTTTPPTPEPAE